MKFYLDTANVDYIKQLLPQLIDAGVKPSDILGVTTNPNAMNKVGANSLKEWQEVTGSLGVLIDELKGDDRGEIHIQFPNSLEARQQRVDSFTSLFDVGRCKVVIKLPPYSWARAKVGGNVTGLADAGTALFSSKTPTIKYLSLIPGRMEAAGIENTEDHIRYTVRGLSVGQKVITGSLRTLEDCIKYSKLGTLPTIGEKVLNDISDFSMLGKSYLVDVGDSLTLCPVVTDKSRILTQEFFKSMDNLGKQVWETI